MSKQKLIASVDDLSYAAETLSQAGGVKSKAIRKLTSEGWKTGRIALALEIRYQWVYNVQHQIIKG